MVRIITTPFITAAEIPRKAKGRADSPLFKQQYFEQKKHTLKQNPPQNCIIT